MDLPRIPGASVHSGARQPSEGRKTAVRNHALVRKFGLHCFYIYTYLYDRVYAFLAVYLFVCSIWLTVKSFRVGDIFLLSPYLSLMVVQEVSLAGNFTAIFEPPVGPLIAAMVSTFGE